MTAELRGQHMFNEWYERQHTRRRCPAPLVGKLALSGEAGEPLPLLADARRTAALMLPVSEKRLAPGSDGWWTSLPFWNMPRRSCHESPEEDMLMLVSQINRCVELRLLMEFEKCRVLVRRNEFQQRARQLRSLPDINTISGADDVGPTASKARDSGEGRGVARSQEQACERPTWRQFGREQPSAALEWSADGQTSNKRAACCLHDAALHHDWLAPDSSPWHEMTM